MSDIRQSVGYDESEDKLIIKRVQDVEPILEANKKAFNEADKHFKSEAFNHVASIPLIIIEQYQKKGIDLLNDDEALKQFLNDPENRYFRTKPGRI